MVTFSELFRKDYNQLPSLSFTKKQYLYNITVASAAEDRNWFIVCKRKKNLYQNLLFIKTTTKRDMTILMHKCKQLRMRNLCWSSGRVLPIMWQTRRFGHSPLARNPSRSIKTTGNWYLNLNINFQIGNIITL